MDQQHLLLVWVYKTKGNTTVSKWHKPRKLLKTHGDPPVLMTSMICGAKFEK